MSDCTVCGAGDRDRATIHRGEPQCCENHRKEQLRRDKEKADA